MKGTISRKDITLEEQIEYLPTFSGPEETQTQWEARFCGELPSGETLEMRRTSQHAGEALLLLEDALKELGLELR